MGVDCLLPQGQDNVWTWGAAQAHVWVHDSVTGEVYVDIHDPYYHQKSKDIWDLGCHLLKA